MTPQQAARYQTPTPGNLRAAYSGGPASLAGWLIARLVMTIGTHQSDHTLSEKAEASFEESDPQRLNLVESPLTGRATITPPMPPAYPTPSDSPTHDSIMPTALKPTSP